MTQDQKPPKRVDQEMNYPSYLLSLIRDYVEARKTPYYEEAVDRIVFLVRSLQPQRFKKRVEKRCRQVLGSNRIQKMVNEELTKTENRIREKAEELTYQSEKEAYIEEHLEPEKRRIALEICDQFYEVVLEEAAKIGLLFDLRSEYKEELEI